jgi:thiamine transport system substrate-binding protein
MNLQAISSLVIREEFMFKKRSHQLSAISYQLRKRKRQEARGKSLSMFFLFSFLLSPFSSPYAQTLRVLTHDSFAVSQDIVDEFTAQTGITLEFLPAGDAGEVVNRAILTKENPLADVLYGIDNSLLARAVNEDIFIPYQSLELTTIPEQFQFDEKYYLTPVDVGYINFNLDKAYFEEKNLALPTNIAELTTEPYKGLTVIQNPATSSTGLGFILATIARFGEEGDYTWLDYWRDLRENDVQVTSGWSEAYYTSFTRYGGDRPIVLSYASSPSAEGGATVNLFCDLCVYEQIEAVGILKGSKNVEAAQTFIDFMVSEKFQSDVPGQMFVYPVVEGVQLPSEFEQFAAKPSLEQIARLTPNVIEVNLQRWLKEWTAVIEQGQ